MAQNNWRLVRNGKIGTKDSEVWFWAPDMPQAGYANPTLAVEAGATHWKKVVDWERDPGVPGPIKRLEAEVQDVMDMVDEPRCPIPDDDELPF